MTMHYSWQVLITSPILGDVLFQSGRAPSRDEAIEMGVRYAKLYAGSTLIVEPSKVN